MLLSTQELNIQYLGSRTYGCSGGRPIAVLTLLIRVWFRFLDGVESRAPRGRGRGSGKLNATSMTAVNLLITVFVLC